MNLTCVKCTSVLDKARVGDVEVDLCPSCGGLWLDHGEIERLGRGKPEDLTRLRTALAGTAAPDAASDTTHLVPGLPGRAQGSRPRAGAHRVLQQVPRHLPRPGELDEAVKAVAGTTVRQVLTLAGAVAKA